MTDITQVRLSGLGGQGIVLAGLLLGQAGANDGKYVSGSHSYGAQARGSECRSEIIFSKSPVDFPHLIVADFFLSMSQGTYDLYANEVEVQSGLIFYDRTLVVPQEDLRVKQVGVPATDYAVKKLKNKQVANIVALGAFIEITRLVSSRAIRKAMSIHIHERLQPLNLKALQAGMRLGRELHG